LAAFRVPANRADEAGALLILDRALWCAVADFVRDQFGIGDFAEPFELGTEKFIFQVARGRSSHSARAAIRSIYSSVLVLLLRS
jgi:hypothetical protein